jgi:phage terminase large subunit-like protein
MENEVLNTIRADFLTFSAMVARDLDKISIEHQPYLQRMAHVLTGVYDGKINHLVLRAPPRHFKTKMAGCLAAFELGRNPRLEIVWMSYDEPTAAESVDYVRDIVRLPWYQAVYPETCLSFDHDRSGDFRTSKGGGLRAIGIHGKVTGKGVDLLIGDDVLDIRDWNNEDEIENVIASLEIVIPSRFNTPSASRAILLGHRLNHNDAGSHFVEKGWTVEAQAFEAVTDEDIELGHGIWHRKKGELLRPDAYSEKIVAELREKVDPPYGYYFQQGLDKLPIVIEASDFRMCERGRHGAEPIVLSVDTALRSEPNHSYNVIQAWAFDGTHHLLREQFRQHCLYDVLEEQFSAMVKKFHPYAAIIEETAHGPGLIRFAQKLGIKVVPVKPSGTKANRLAAHNAAIRQGRIHVARHLYGEFTDEIENLPRHGTDQTDSFSQYLSHRPSPPRIEVHRPVSTPAMSHASQISRDANPPYVAGAATAYGSRIGNYAPPLGTGWHTLRSSAIGK